MCFCKMEYRQQIFKEKMSIDWNEPNMKDFGEYAIIVKIQKSLLEGLIMQLIIKIINIFVET